MKAFILSAGKGSRLYPITDTKPKPLVEIYQKPIIDHILENIYKHVSEIIIIVKYKAEDIKNHLGDHYKGTKITYKDQGEKEGTAAGLKGEKYELDCIVMNGDSIFDKKDIQKLIDFQGYGGLVQTVDNPREYGIYKIDEDNNIKEIVEKPQEYIGNLANLGVYKFNSKIFEYINQVSLSKRGEYEITCAINLFAKNYPFKAIEIEKDFIDISYPWDILRANAYFLNQLKESDIQGEIEEGVTIKGNIILEEGAILKSGTYIEGNVYIKKSAVIGPNAYLRGPSIIGKASKIGFCVEIKNSSIGNNTNIPHLSYIGDSIIGNQVNIGGGFLSAQLRHDEKNIRCMVKGELIDTKLQKFGIIIGDEAKTGANTVSYPGRILPTRHYTKPGDIIK